MQKKRRRESQSRSADAKSKETRSYLEPNSISMQKPIGGRSVLAFSAAKSMFKHKNSKGKSCPMEEAKKTKKISA